MVKIDKTLPYPYLPGYTGTYEDRHRVFKRRLAELLSYLEQLEIKVAQNENDISLLVDLEKCHCLVVGMLED